ncbi:MAG: hypothetical protein SAJ12_18540 [Jaaginema sp. PMC 1079.18]|nr:hypothetical protein [Jaaginema sp. PMC 1080.18]MEC4852984.1 hypothetical protein [Jaaginema sp. PMC 1079.18]MEC4865967.1 hypothetical protein [Jaaginema sp. PMC 1078.18]
MITALRSNYISSQELESALRQQASVTQPSQIVTARLESNGNKGKDRRSRDRVFLNKWHF